MGIENRFYFYKDMDMTQVLEARLAEEGMDDGSISVLGAMRKKGELLAHVNENRKVFPGPKTLLIPYNVGFQHWVGIILKYDDEGKAKSAEYMDSLSIMGGTPSQSLINEVHDIDPKFNLKVRDASQQYDFFSCGAYAIENLLAAAKGSPPPPIYSTTALRAWHAACKKKHRERRLPISGVKKPKPIIMSNGPDVSSNPTSSADNDSSAETSQKTPTTPSNANKKLDLW